jgi:hypothetical protein
MPLHPSRPHAFAALGPSFEVPVSAPTIARAPGTQQQPHVATDGRDFFAVWLDGRGGTTSVFGTRVLADGTVLDPTGILIASPGVECDSPGLVWDGSNYVVVWREHYDDPYFFTRSSFARIDHNGTVLGGPKTLLDHSRGQSLIASNGHGSVVIFAAFSGSVVRIDQDGSVSQRHTLGTGGDLQIASNGDGYLLSWTGPDTALLRLDDNGDAAGSAQQLIDTVYYTQLAARIGRGAASGGGAVGLRETFHAETRRRGVIARDGLRMNALEAQEIFRFASIGGLGSSLTTRSGISA